MKESMEEWQALNRIWKAMTEDQRNQCREDFRIVATSKRFIEDDALLDKVKELEKAKPRSFKDIKSLSDMRGTANKQNKETEHWRESETVKPKENIERLRVQEGYFVKLWDCNREVTLEYEIVAQTQKTFYKGSYFHEGNHYYSQELVLDTGGNGITSISLESPIGKAIKGKMVGDVVSYMNNKKEEEQYEIVEITKYRRI